ncbi:MAG: AlkZ family DNA glycosylase [Myxococcales bacterium]|nr:AlkZ family DNA glycosylase [Myxococcales bacterium]
MQDGPSPSIVRSIVGRRLEAQLISSSPFTRPVDVVRRLGAVQAQDYLGSLWAIGLRLSRGSEGDVERAIAERTIVRTWPMRGTLHFVAADDARWMIEHLARRGAAAAASRLRAMGIDDAVLSRARRALVAELEGGRRLVRDAAYRVLERARIATMGDRGLQILWSLAHEGLVCLGAREGKQHTIVLLDEWLAPARRLGRDEALGELAARYFTGHGPATARDFAWWSGLSLTDARWAIGAAGALLTEENIAGETYWCGRATHPEAPRRSGAHALPAFDEFFVGYKDRFAAVDPAHAAALDAFDLLGPCILVDGRLAATWKRRLSAATVTCSTKLLAPLRAEKLASLRRALDRYARFLGRDVVVEAAEPRRRRRRR